MLLFRLVSISLFVFIVGCQKEESVDNVPSVDAMELEAALQIFQLQLFKDVLQARSDDKNVLVSPLSVASALYMTLNGARGETKTAMESTLTLKSQDREILDQMHLILMNQLDQSQSSTKLSQANAIFFDKNRMSLNDDFSDLMKQYFAASIHDLVFQEATALEIINDWVSESTKGRIEKIIEEIDPAEVMFLINALYFTGDWSLPFAEEATNQQIFNKADGSIAEVPIMFKDQALSFYEGEDFKAVELFFADTNYSMQFLLPPADQAVRSFAASMSNDRLNKLSSEDLQEGRIILHLPRFQVAYKIVLNEVLKSMGMGVAFDRNSADLSGLGNAPEGNLFINRVNHKTFLKIDEKGAEGAAVTSVGVGVTSLPPVLRFDRPFVYLLKHRPSGAIVFLGILDDPSIP